MQVCRGSQNFNEHHQYHSLKLVVTGKRWKIKKDYYLELRQQCLNPIEENSMAGGD